MKQINPIEPENGGRPSSILIKYGLLAIVIVTVVLVMGVPIIVIGSKLPE